MILQDIYIKVIRLLCDIVIFLLVLLMVGYSSKDIIIATDAWASRVTISQASIIDHLVAQEESFQLPVPSQYREIMHI